MKTGRSNPMSGWPLSLYFGDMALSAITFHLMYYLISKEHNQAVRYQRSIRDYLSFGAYILVTALAGFCPLAAYIVIAAVTIWWIIPSKKDK